MFQTWPTGGGQSCSASGGRLLGMADTRRGRSRRDLGAPHPRTMPAVNGFVAVTDTGWFERLAARPSPQEVNFWRPSVRADPFDRLAQGTPFLFKLKVPHNAIAGFGYFISLL